MARFSEELRARSAADWDAAVNHRFVDEIFRGAVPPDAMRRYLIQDYQFIDAFVALLGAAIASADRFAARISFARFAAMITSDENTYFLRAFDALGVPPADRETPPLAAPTRDFQALMREAVASLDYACCLAVLSVAEGLYLDWADRGDAALPQDFVHREWITLHCNPDFRAFVTWLRSELDRIGAVLDPARKDKAASFFARAVEMERRFFDHVYE